MEARALAVLALLVATLAPLPGVASGEPACALLATPTRLAQDDADLGRDAPDRAQDALLLPVPPPTPNGALDAYFWGWLDPWFVREGADHHDWYLVPLKGEGELVMVEVASNYTDDALSYGFALELYAPGDATPTVTLRSGDARHEFVNDRPGDWRIHVAPIEGAPATCEPLARAPVPTPGPMLMRNHGVYFGCDPFCLDEGAHLR